MGFWIISIALLAFFVYVASMNGTVFVQGFFLKKPDLPSWAPIIGGASGAAGLLLLPVPGASRYWWLPLILDWGSLPGIAHTIFFLVKNSIKDHRQEKGRLAKAAERGDLSTIGWLMSGGKVDMNEIGTDKQTALMLASRRGHIEVVKVLLKGGADPNLQEEYYGQTALTLAAFKGHTAVVKALLENGADPNLEHNDGLTPLMMAAWSLDPDEAMVRMLLDSGADVTRKNDEGHTALKFAEGRRFLEFPNDEAYALDQRYARIRDMLQQHLQQK